MQRVVLPNPPLRGRLKLRIAPSLSLAALLLLAALLPASTAAQADTSSDVFTEAEASKLLKQVADGLQGHSKRKMLSAFDLSRMDGGPLFAEHITAFFNEYDSIRVHFKLVQVKDNVAVVDAEMDSTPRNAADPPQHKNLQLRFTAATTAGGWRFVDLQPRNFFA